MEINNTEYHESDVLVWNEPIYKPQSNRKVNRTRTESKPKFQYARRKTPGERNRTLWSLDKASHDTKEMPTLVWTDVLQYDPMRRLNTAALEKRLGDFVKEMFDISRPGGEDDDDDDSFENVQVDNHNEVSGDLDNLDGGHIDISYAYKCEPYTVVSRKYMKSIEDLQLVENKAKDLIGFLDDLAVHKSRIWPLRILIDDCDAALEDSEAVFEEIRKFVQDSKDRWSNIRALSAIAISDALSNAATAQKEYQAKYAIARAEFERNQGTSFKSATGSHHIKSNAVMDSIRREAVADLKEKGMNIRAMQLKETRLIDDLRAKEVTMQRDIDLWEPKHMKMRDLIKAERIKTGIVVKNIAVRVLQKNIRIRCLLYFRESLSYKLNRRGRIAPSSVQILSHRRKIRKLVRARGLITIPLIRLKPHASIINRIENGEIPDERIHSGRSHDSSSIGSVKSLETYHSSTSSNIEAVTLVSSILQLTANLAELVEPPLLRNRDHNLEKDNEEPSP